MFFGPEYKVLRGGSFGADPVGLPGHVPQLGLPDPAADLRRLPQPPATRAPAEALTDVPAPGLPRAARPLRELLIDPPHSLVRQSWAPRRSGTARSTPTASASAGTPDGDPVPAALPAGRPDLGRPVASPTWPRVDPRRRAAGGGPLAPPPGMPVTEAAAAPFAAGRWLFSHNGARRGWPDVGWPSSPRRCPPGDCSRWRRRPTRRCCGRWSAHRLRAGEPPAGGAGRRRRRRAAGRARSRLNLLLTDGDDDRGDRRRRTPCWLRRAGRGRARRPPSRSTTTRPGRCRTVAATATRWRRPPGPPTARPTLDRRPRGGRIPMTDCTVDRPLPADCLGRRAARRRAGRADRTTRSRCRPSGSTTRAAASCSSRSPGCPSTTRPAPSGRSCRARRRDRRGRPAPSTLVELGSGSSEQDPAAARRAAARRDAAPLSCRSTSASRALTEAGQRAAAPTTRAWRARRRRRLHRHLAAAADRAARGWSPSSAAPSAT